MPQMKFQRFSSPRNKKCNCCDCSVPLDFKVLVLKGELLVGDLDLCDQCAAVIAGAGEAATAMVEEWNFGKE